MNLAAPRTASAVVELAEEKLDAETHVILSTGLNYAAHAEEAGGGDVFLFPKPAAPTPPYTPVYPPAGVLLFDYEVELAFVLLEDIDLTDIPDRAELLANTAFFLSNDISDREAIIRRAEIFGAGTGFVEGKGQPGFFPTGPWMVRGTELFSAAKACGAEGLGLRLWVGEEAEPRQQANTTQMILAPEALVERVGTWFEAGGYALSQARRRGARKHRWTGNPDLRDRYGGRPSGGTFLFRKLADRCTRFGHLSVLPARSRPSW